MKNLQKYLICFTIGILIYILLNHKNNGFSVGGKKYGLYEKGSRDHIADHIAESEGDAINHFIHTVSNFDLTNLPFFQVPSSTLPSACVKVPCPCRLPFFHSPTY